MKFFILKRLEIQNANALSSPISVGFPALPAWYGFIHALERKIRYNPEFQDVHFPAFALAAHEYNMHSIKSAPNSDASIVMQKYTAQATGSTLKNASFIEKPKIDLTVSIMVNITGLDDVQHEAFCFKLKSLLQNMKIASGDLISKVTLSEKDIFEVDETNDDSIRKAILQLMPGYILIERKDLLLNSPESSGLDTMLSHLSVMYDTSRDNKGKITKRSPQKAPGWIVPIGVGYRGISALKNVKNQRDPSVPHQFAESLITLCEFKMPHHFDSIDDILWYPDYIAEKNLYLCTTKKEK